MAADTPEAGLQFVSFLQSSKVPEHLWDELVEKIETGAVGPDGLIQVLTEIDFIARCKSLRLG